MAPDPIRITHCLKKLGCCLLFLALFMASGAQAAPILIDNFNDGIPHRAPSDGDPVLDPNEKEVASVLGGYRSLEQVVGDNVIAVTDGDVYDPGFLASLFLCGSLCGGTQIAEWNGQGDSGLGGTDLTAGGEFFELSGVLVTGNSAFFGFHDFTLRVTDTGGMQSTFSRDYSEVRDAVLMAPFGDLLIPFSSLSGEANLALVDGIELEFTSSPVSPGGIFIDSFSVVPEPSTALLFALGLLGLGTAVRRTAPPQGE